MLEFQEEKSVQTTRKFETVLIVSKPLIEINFFQSAEFHSRGWEKHLIHLEQIYPTV